jgi:predicted ferric reductase
MNKLRKNLGVSAILILALFPLFRWATMPGWDFRFMDINSAATSLGQIAGLWGMVLFSLVLILSSRLKFLDHLFYGLNNAYNFHHRLGAIAFALILFHPVFLAVKFIRLSLRDAALFFLPGQNPAVSYGIFALGLMMILIVLTFYIRMKYHRWKFSHKFMVVVFLFAVLHAFFITSDISRDNTLRYYILGLAAFGLVAGGYRAFLSRFLNRNLKYTVKKVRPLNTAVTAITLAPQGKSLAFIPGQFVFARFLSEAVTKEVHPFSITSSPAEKDLELVIKSLGDYTVELKNLKTDDIAFIEGPFGKFSYLNHPNKNQVWVAGGIGITPFIGMARAIRDETYKIDLFYSVSQKFEAVLLDELLKISAQHKNFRVIPWYSAEQGRISAEIITGQSQGLTGKDILLCGPVPFMESLRDQFLKLDVPRKRIHWEKFDLKP